MTQSVHIIAGGTFDDPDNLFPTFYPDYAMTDGCICAYDFLTIECWPSQADAAANDTVVNLVDGGEDATFTATMTFPSGGFRGGITQNQELRLPDTMKFETETDGFLVILWSKYEDQAQASAGSVAGYADGTDNTGPWGIYYANPGYYFIVNGQVYGITKTDLITAIHQVALAFVMVDGQYRAQVYVDNVLVKDAVADNQTLSAPSTPPAYAGLFDEGVSGKSDYWYGNHYRLLGFDLGVADGLTVAEKVARDWESNAGREGWA